MRIAAKDFGPLPLVGVRLLTGVVILLPFLWRARARITRAHWPRFALIGALNSAIPFTLFAWGAERAPAGIGAIANSMTVLFAALVAFVVFREHIGTAARDRARRRLRRRRRSSPADASPARTSLGAAIAGTIASLCYGFAINLTRHWLADLPPVVGVAGTLSCATLMVAPFAIATWPAAPIPAAVVARGDGARRAVHRHRVLAFLPADPARRCAARVDDDVSRADLRRRVGLAAARRAADVDDGCVGGVDSGERDLESA